MQAPGSVLIEFIFLGLIVAGLAFFFFRSLFRSQTPPLPTTERRFIDLDDCRVSYLREGRGPELVLLHGIGASNYIWRFVRPLWISHFTITAIDIPGFGFSSKDRGLNYGIDAQALRLVKFLDRLDVGKATLVGSSMGGAICLWAAKLYPERFKKTVVLAPATNPTLVPSIVALLPFFSFLHRAANRWTIRPFVSNAMTRTELITPETLAAYSAPYQDPNSLHALYLATQTIRDPRLPQELKTIKGPVLLMYGQKDKVVPEFYMKELRAILPNVIYKAHPTAGHHPMEDEPEWVAKEVLAFLS
jgi:pimeloyl-ACP methyl ester carboxylesterase